MRGMRGRILLHMTLVLLVAFVIGSKLVGIKNKVSELDRNTTKVEKNINSLEVELKSGFGVALEELAK